MVWLQFTQIRNVIVSESPNDHFASVTIENKSRPIIALILPSIYQDMPGFDLEVTSPGVCKLFSGLDSKKIT